MAKNTIIVKDYNHIRDEKVAAGAITPGMLVERTSADKVQAHNSAGAPVQKIFAIEDAPQGNGISDAYAADDTVLLWHATPGEQVYGILDDASAVEAIVIGDFVESAGDGRLRKVTVGSAETGGYSNSIVGVALEAQSTPEGRFIVEIL